MIVHKFTLMIAGILGLLAQISMAQSSATMTTSTLPAVQTGLVAGSDNNISSAYDYELYTGDSDEGNDEYLDEDYEDIDEYLDEDNALDKDEFFDIDDSEMSMIVKVRILPRFCYLTSNDRYSWHVYRRMDDQAIAARSPMDTVAGKGAATLGSFAKLNITARPVVAPASRSHAAATSRSSIKVARG